MHMHSLMDIVEYLDHWLDSEVSPDYIDQPLAQDWARVAKCSEEVGEAIDALIGYTGQSPRKGQYGDINDLLNELADVALTGLYAMQHFLKDADGTLNHLMARARHHRDRIEGRLDA